MSGLADSWLRSLRAANRAAATLEAYQSDLAEFTAHYDGDPADATRADVENFIVFCRDRGLADATVARRFQSLRQFYRWAEEEGEVDTSPMLRMKPPKVAIRPPDVIDPADFAKLIEACRGERVNGERRKTRQNKSDWGRGFDFECRRDEAMLRLLWTTGVRAGEIMGIAVADIDLNAETFTVTGKGNRLRIVALLPQPAEAVDRYLRVRRKHEAHNEPWLWLGRRGRLGQDGLRQMLERRCHDAGIDPINPHRFRHTFAHEAKKRGMADDALMVVAGWQSPQMLQRYGASAAAERSRDAHRRLFGGGS